MGDRAYTTIEVKAKDKEAMLEIVGGPPAVIDRDDDIFMASWEELDWGGDPAHETLKKRKIAHIITWDSGQTFAPGSTYFDSESQFSVEFSYLGDTPIVEVYDDGGIDTETLEEIENWYDGCKEFRA